MDNEIYDVAVVGYGPVGQLLAILLGQKGYRVAVFERWHQVYPLPRALHYDHEIARVLQAAGVIVFVASPVTYKGITERLAIAVALAGLAWIGQALRVQTTPGYSRA